jgi:hypothetical protein
VTSQFGAVTQSAGLKQYANVRTACEILTGDLKTAQAAPPIPDAAMQKLYAKALRRMAAAAAECINAISVKPYGDEDLRTKEKTTLLDHSLGGFDAAAKELYRATAYIQAMARH